MKTSPSKRGENERPDDPGRRPSQNVKAGVTRFRRLIVKLALLVAIAGGSFCNTGIAGPDHAMSAEALWDVTNEMSAEEFKIWAATNIFNLTSDYFDLSKKIPTFPAGGAPPPSVLATVGSNLTNLILAVSNNIDTNFLSLLAHVKQQNSDTDDALSNKLSALESTNHNFDTRLADLLSSYQTLSSEVENALTQEQVLTNQITVLSDRLIRLETRVSRLETTNGTGNRGRGLPVIHVVWDMEWNFWVVVILILFAFTWGCQVRLAGRPVTDESGSTARHSGRQPRWWFGRRPKGKGGPAPESGTESKIESAKADIGSVEKESARISALEGFVQDFKGQMAGLRGGLENSLKVKNGEQEARLKEFWKSINETLDAKLKTFANRQPVVPSPPPPEPPIVPPPVAPVIVASPPNVLATGEKVPKELSEAESIGLCFMSFCQERRYEFPLGEFLAELKQTFPEALGKFCYRPAIAHPGNLYFEDQTTSGQKYWRVTVNENNYLLPAPANQQKFDGVEGFMPEGTGVTPEHLRYCQPALLCRQAEVWEVQERGRLREDPDPELPRSWSGWLSPAKPPEGPVGEGQTAVGTGPVEAVPNRPASESRSPAGLPGETGAEPPAAVGGEELETGNPPAEGNLDFSLIGEKVILVYLSMCQHLQSDTARKLSVTVHFGRRIQEERVSDDDFTIQHATYFADSDQTQFQIAPESSEFWLVTIRSSGEQLLFPHYRQLKGSAPLQFEQAFRIYRPSLPGPNDLDEFVPCRVAPAGKGIYSIQTQGKIKFKNDR